MKMLKVALVVLVMAAMVTPVIAEDRLSLNGEMRVRGWHKDRDFDNFTNAAGVRVKSDDSTQTWGDQRLRIGGKIAVAEGVSITFRTDITESNWGTTGGGNGFGSGRSGANQQWDRAHIDLTKGSLHVRAGQFYQAYGKTYALDSQDNGLSADYVIGDGSVNVFFMVDNDNGSKTQSDAFLSGVKYSAKMDKIAFDVFAGNYKQNAKVGGTGLDAKENDADVTLIGADVTVPFDAFKLVAEVDFFTGDSSEVKANGSQLDAFGTQFMLDGSFAISDAFTLGGAFYYGQGDDEDIQYTNIGNGFGGWDPVMDIGSSLSNEQIAYGSPFNVATIAQYEGDDLSLTAAGSVGGRLYTNYKVNDDFTLGATVGYFASEEDKVADLEVMTLAGGFVYQLMENTSIQWQLQYVSGTANQTDYTAVNGDIDFDAFEMGSGLFVKF
jgi:hypothetical protein